MNKVTKWGKKLAHLGGSSLCLSVRLLALLRAGFWALRVSHLRLRLQLLLFPAWEFA